jgi:ubiquinone/menaquinone biosynthesis C-methylase UbiE
MGSQGRLISSDVNAQGLKEMRKKYKAMKKRKSSMASIESLHFSDDYFDANKFPTSLDGSLDAVVSLATFHHFDNRAPEFDTGHQGKTLALAEFKRMLKPGGRLVIADICDQTCTQRYFDAVDSPIHFYPTGHPHDFFDRDSFRSTLESLGYHVDSLELRETPWVFDSMAIAATYMNRLHNAKCSPEESLAIAEREIGFKQVGKQYHLQWCLMFLYATKRYDH